MDFVPLVGLVVQEDFSSSWSIIIGGQGFKRIHSDPKCKLLHFIKQEG